MKFFLLALLLALPAPLQAENLPYLPPVTTPALSKHTLVNNTKKPLFIRTNTIEKADTQKLKALLEPKPTQKIQKAQKNPAPTPKSPTVPQKSDTTSLTIALAPTTYTHSFAEKLETLGDTHGAAIAWQQLAYTSVGHAQAKALIQSGVLYTQLGKNNVAYRIFSQFLSTFMNHPQRPKALYYLAFLTPSPTEQGKFLQALKVNHPTSPFTKEAAYRITHTYAQTHQLTSTFEDPRAQSLKTRLEEHTAKTAWRPRIAAFLSAIPGLGHLYVGEWKKALALFIATPLLLWALYYAIMWGQTPYALIWGITALTLYTYGFYNSVQIAKTQNITHRAETIKSWQDLTPPRPKDIF